METRTARTRSKKKILIKKKMEEKKEAATCDLWQPLDNKWGEGHKVEPIADEPVSQTKTC